ncbi:MAG: hypothetical protein ABMA64_34100 [Myxococcota bacterium]
MDVGRAVTEHFKVYLCAAALLLALAWPLVPAKWRRQGLLALVLLAGANYARWGTEALTTRVDAYDLLHYYVNAKYFDELGYLDLYPAMLVVDADNDGPFFAQGETYMAQDAQGHHFAPIAQGIARGREIRPRFTDERWAEFSHDVLYLERTVGCRDRDRRGRCLRELSDELYRQLINDHGFNGTTTWTLVARPFTVVPVEWVKLLGYIDVVLLAAALGAVAWAYGGTTAGWTLLFLLVTYSTRWPYFSWAFLRYDWVAALLGATALLKKGRPLAAGVLAGWAATLRLFPAMWMWGMFCKGVAGLAGRRLERPALWLAAGFVATVIALQGAAVAQFGTHSVVEHFENMMDHNSAEQLSSRRIGLALALATEPWRGTATEMVITPARKAKIDAQEPLRYGIALATMVALGYAVRRRGDDEAFGYGFLPFFLLTTASYYYYVCRATLIVLHASDLDRWRNRVALALLFGLELFSNAAETFQSGHRLFLIGTLAWGLWLYAVVAIGWLILDDTRADRTNNA